MSLAVPPDLEFFLVRYMKTALDARGLDVLVSNRPPADMTVASGPVLVIRDDGGPQTSAVTYSRAVAFIVYAGTWQDEKSARDLAGLVYALASAPAVALAAGSPIAAANYQQGNVGPYRDPEASPRASFYSSIQYSVAAVLED